jgi:hypothetical protein
VWLATPVRTRHFRRVPRIAEALPSRSFERRAQEGNESMTFRNCPVDTGEAPPRRGHGRSPSSWHAPMAAQQILARAELAQLERELKGET